MTVQQERPTAVVAPRTSPELRLPAQRLAEPVEQPQLRGWGSAEDRTTALSMIAFMLGLGLFVALMLTIGIRV